ncbi:hypothetical protein [Novosphingobium humi]|uniref:Uncharacterized protein n=1 Tax=Novosphingobium humi TaxID=2282397 RepID=A0ABY7TUQ6_9SPHN|nr:hypothetical protein [Novosphingobium humi]WCT76346.1 hypothetical protein PQ457_10325 [Novosphingobium humi]WJS97205.1 hypothetical protein NYQ05_08470 [Novosphingobium humi]
MAKKFMFIRLPAAGDLQPGSSLDPDCPAGQPAKQGKLSWNRHQAEKDVQGDIFAASFWYLDPFLPSFCVNGDLQYG